MSQTAAERKRAQRDRDRSQGYIEIVVKVPVSRAREARQWCALLAPKPRRRRADERQMDLVEYMEQQHVKI